jgi:hypothetical protein
VTTGLNLLVWKVRMMRMTKVNDQNRQSIVTEYCTRLLDDMDFDTLYFFAYDMLYDNKKGLTNEQLTNQISDYYPDLLEETNEVG